MAGAEKNGFWLPLAIDPADVPEAFENFATKSSMMKKFVAHANSSDPHTAYLTNSRGDARYARKTHSHGATAYSKAQSDARYLRLTGGTVTGVLTVTTIKMSKTKYIINEDGSTRLNSLTLDKGRSDRPSLNLNPSVPDSGIYSDHDGEISITMDKSRTLSIISAAHEANKAFRGRVIVRSNKGTPLKIERNESGMTWTSGSGKTVMLRFSIGGRERVFTAADLIKITTAV